MQFDSCHRKFNLELRTFFEDSIIVNDEPEDHVDETEDDNEEDDDVMDYDEDEDDEESDDEDDEPTKLNIKLFYQALVSGKYEKVQAMKITKPSQNYFSIDVKDSDRKGMTLNVLVHVKKVM